MSFQVIISILVAIGTLSYFIPTPQELRASFIAGQNYFAARNYMKAIEQYDKILETESSLLTSDSVKVTILNGDLTVGVRTASLYQKANAYRVLNNIDSSISTFHKVLQRYDSPKLRVLSQYQIYDLLLQKKLYDSAIVEARNLVTEFPNDEKVEQALYDIGWAFHFEKRYDSSSVAFQYLADKYPAGQYRVRALYQIGQNAMDLHDWKKGLRAFSLLVTEYKPESFSRTDFQNMELRVNRERQIFEAASNRESDNSNLELVSKADFKIAEAYEQLQQNDSAVARYQYIVKTYTLLPSLVEISYIKMSELIFRLKGLEEAVAVYRKAIDDNFENKVFQARMQYKIARTYQDNKEFEKSAKEYNFYVKAFGEYADQADFSLENARFFAVLNFNAAKDYNDVIAAADSFLFYHAGSEFSPKALIMRGMALQHEGKFEQARESYAAMIKDYPSSGEVMHAKMQRAKSFYDEKLYKEAVQEYEQLEKNTSDEAELSEVRYFLGMSYFFLPELNAALASLEKVEASSQFYPFAFGRIVKIYSSQNKFDEGEKYITQVLKTLPDSSEYKPYAHLSYGELLALQGKFDNAIDEMSTVLKDTTVNENALLQARYSRGALYQQVKKYKEAVADLEKVLAEPAFKENFTSTVPTANEKLALAYIGIGKRKEAVSRISDLLKQSATDEQKMRYLSALVELNVQLNDFEKVIEYGTEVLRSPQADDNTKAKTYVSISNAYGNLQKVEDVVRVLSEAADSLHGHPYIGQVLYETAMLFYDGGGYQYAEMLFKKFLEVYPSKEQAEDALYKRAECLMKTNRLDDGAKVFRSYIAKYPNSDKISLAQYTIAETYYNAEQFDKAIREYAVTAKEFPKSDYATTALYNIGWCFYRLGDTLKMVESFERFVQTYPNSKNAPDAQFSIGDYYYNMKEYAKAKTAYQVILEKYPNYSRIEEAKSLVRELEQINSYLEYAEAIKLFDAEQFKEAIPLLENVIKKYPDADVRYACEANIASAYEELGQRKKALEMFTEIIKKYSEKPEAQMVVFFAEQHKRWIESGKSK